MKRREHSRLLSTSLSVQGPRSKVSILPTNVRPEGLEPPTERFAQRVSPPIRTTPIVRESTHHVAEQDRACH